MEQGMKYIILFIILMIVLIAFFVGVLPRITEQAEQGDTVINETLGNILEGGDKFIYEMVFKEVGDYSV